MDQRVPRRSVQRPGVFEPLPPERESRALNRDTYQLLPVSGHKAISRLSLPKTTPWDAIFRSFGLSIIYTKLKGIKHEYRKVAICKSWKVALPRLLLHFIPVGASIVLIWLNISGYYLGVEAPGIQGHNNAKLGALQFASKMHEIMIMASLSMIVFHFVQLRIVANEVSFATLFAGFQYQSLNYFWSKELWQIIGAERRRWRNFLPVLIIAMILAPTIGPSSAVLMIPKSDQYSAGGIDFWLNTTKGELWPLDITPDVFGVNPSCSKDPDELTCPSSGWESFASQFLTSFRNVALPGSPYNYVNPPNGAAIPGKYGSRNVRFGRGVNWTMASCPTRVLSDSLVVTSQFWDDASGCPPRREHFAWRESATWSISGLQQAMTRVACFASSDGNVRFPKLDPMRDFDDLGLRSTSGLFNLTNPYWVDQVTKMSKSNRSELLWLTLNRTTLGNYSLGAIATVPSNHENSTITVGCEIDPHWVDAKYSIKQSQIAGVYGATWITEPQIYPDAWVYHPVPPLIRISHDWAEYLNPLISSSNQTAFEHMVLLAGQIGPENLNVLTDFTEMVIAGMVSNGLSNLSPLAALQGKRPVARECVPAWYDPFMPQHSTSLGSFGKGGTFWNMSGIDTSHMTKYKMDAFVTGYAFSSNGPTAIVAIVILLIYCLVAISHTLYVCFTCRSSSSWDSIPEIVALAMQSPPTKVLKNTGAGISTKNIFKHDVQIRDVDGRVQLMFDDTKNGSVSVEENKEYG